jgi:geranylgeranyl pyrophosphate synthase
VAAGVGGEEHLNFSDAVGRVAMAIEAFHKASLVHDDIEDDDLYRYGQQTLHRRYDLGTAINVGDYLIGLGYRLVSSARQEIGADAAADILERMAAAHVKLCDGQGAEMAWQNTRDLSVTPLDALQIYALKTSPAFEAALFAGLRMAGPVDAYEKMIPAFARHVGIGFQILNDLKDWRGDDDNKLIAGQDALSLRPTVLLAMALDSAEPPQRAELEELLDNDEVDAMKIGRLRRIFVQCGVFDKAEAIVEKSRARAEAIADGVEPDELRRLLYFLIDTILASETPEVKPDPSVLVSLPIAAEV